MAVLAFLFTDIESSTQLLQRLGGDVYSQVLADHHALIRSGLAANQGREVDTAGDGFFAVFDSPSSCVAAALQMQRALAVHAWPGGEPVRVRMGVHAGEAEQTGVGFVGLEVHRAARIAAVAHGGQVLVSDAAATLAGDALPGSAALRDLGTHRLKDLGRPEQLYQLSAPGLQAEFPPLRSLGNPALPNNLPAQLATFIGREQEIAAVQALVESSRLVTLTGPGGAGKTRLGLQVAADLLDGFGDGAWLAELAAVTDQDMIGEAIAAALRIPARPGQPVLDTLADALGPQHVLIVLDNCEHVIGGCAKAVEAVVQRCQKVHVIATSREPLGISGEQIYRVPSLSLPSEGDESGAGSWDAVALLADRARSQGAPVPMDAAGVALAVSVCRRLDGMPLAIELAAARLRSMSLGELASRLDQRFRLLTGGSRTALERHQTLRAAVSWSYSLLTGLEQVLLRRLSVFAGGFDLSAAEGVCGTGPIDPADVAVLLGSLVDKSLVVAEPAGGALRYRLLETIRLYAAEQLAEISGDEAEAVHAAHTAYFLALAESVAPHLYRPDQARWLALLDAEHANMLRAAHYAADVPDGVSQALRFGVALARYWRVRAAEDEAAGLLLPVLERPEAAADPALFAEGLIWAAESTVFTDLATSLRLAERADEVIRRLGDDRLLAMSCIELSWTYYLSGEPERARPPAEEGVRRARQLDDDRLLCDALGTYALALGASRAGPLFAEVVACADRSGDIAGRGWAQEAAGVAALEIGDVGGAKAHLQAAIRDLEAVGDPHSSASVNLADALWVEGDLEAARTAFAQALRICRRIGDLRGIAGAVLGMACVAGDLGDWRWAAALHGAAQAVLGRTGMAWEEWNALRRQKGLGQAASNLGDEQFQHGYARGLALTLEQAIDLALGKNAFPDEAAGSSVPATA